MNTNNPNDNESAALRAANAEIERELNVLQARYNALHARFGIQGAGLRNERIDKQRIEKERRLAWSKPNTCPTSWAIAASKS